MKIVKGKEKNKMSHLSRTALGLVLIGMLTLAGCWDIQEIRNRGIVNVVFIDIGDAKKFKMGIVATVPGSQAPTIVGTYQQFTKRYYVLSGEGDSIVKAWTEVQAKSFRDIFFGQIRAVILSEQIARENINDLLDFIGRIPLVPPSTLVMIAKTDPEKLLDIKNNPNELPGNYLDFYFQSSSKRSLAIPVDLWQLYVIIDRKTGDPYIPVFEESQGDYKIGGTALFSRNRMVGKISMDETIILNLVRGTDYGYLTIPLGENRYVSVDNVRSKTKVRPQISADGRLTFSVKTEIAGNLVEKFPHHETMMKEKKEIEKRAAMVTKRKIQDLIEKLQGMNSDPLGFGGKIRIKYPHKWNQIDWRQVYPTAKFNVSTKFTLKKTGLFR